MTLPPLLADNARGLLGVANAVLAAIAPFESIRERSSNLASIGRTVPSALISLVRQQSSSAVAGIVVKLRNSLASDDRRAAGLDKSDATCGRFSLPKDGDRRVQNSHAEAAVELPIFRQNALISQVGLPGSLRAVDDA